MRCVSPAPRERKSEESDAARAGPVVHPAALHSSILRPTSNSQRRAGSGGGGWGGGVGWGGVGWGKRRGWEK